LEYYGPRLNNFEEPVGTALEVQGISGIKADLGFLQVILSPEEQQKELADARFFLS
jgi:hypothetical protein